MRALLEGEDMQDNGTTTKERLDALLTNYKAKFGALFSVRSAAMENGVQPVEASRLAGRPKKILVISSDVLPLPGMLTTGAGLRAWGLGQGLKARGHNVIFAMPNKTAKACGFKPDGKTLVYPEEAFARFVYQVRPDVLLLQHWPWANALPKPYPYTVIDLHGPIILESLFRIGDQIRELVHRKLNAFARADFFTCAGERQRNYFYAWLTLAGFDLRKVPLEVVPFSLAPECPEHIFPDDDTITFVYGGVFLPWQDPVFGLRVLIEEMAAAGKGHLYFFGGNHPWLQMPKQPRFEQIQDMLMHSPHATLSPAIPRDELIGRYQRASVAWDVMSYNCERGMAFTSRTAEYLWAGLPVVYNHYSELSEYIRRYDAGWIVDPEDEGALRRTVRDILANPQEIRRKGQNAQRLAGEALNWVKTVEPIERFIQDPERFKAQRFSESPYVIDPMFQAERAR